MDTEVLDTELAGKLRRLDAAEADVTPAFDYQGLLTRHAAGKARARRRMAAAQGTASALMLAMVALSVWRLSPRDPGVVEAAAPPAAAAAEVPQHWYAPTPTWRWPLSKITSRASTTHSRMRA
jgi:hypothetical protein